MAAASSDCNIFIYYAVEQIANSTYSAKSALQIQCENSGCEATGSCNVGGHLGVENCSDLPPIQVLNGSGHVEAYANFRLALQQINNDDNLLSGCTLQEDKQYWPPVAYIGPAEIGMDDFLAFYFSANSALMGDAVPVVSAISSSMLFLEKNVYPMFFRTRHSVACKYHALFSVMEYMEWSRAIFFEWVDVEDTSVRQSAISYFGKGLYGGTAVAKFDFKSEIVFGKSSFNS